MCLCFEKCTRSGVLPIPKTRNQNRRIAKRFSPMSPPRRMGRLPHVRCSIPEPAQNHPVRIPCTHARTQLKGPAKWPGRIFSVTPGCGELYSTKCATTQAARIGDRHRICLGHRRCRSPKRCRGRRLRPFVRLPRVFGCAASSIQSWRVGDVAFEHQIDQSASARFTAGSLARLDTQSVPQVENPGDGPMRHPCGCSTDSSAVPRTVPSLPQPIRRVRRPRWVPRQQC